MPDDRNRGDNLDLLRRVVWVVGAGHYNNYVRDRLAAVFDAYEKPESAAAVRGLPDRSFCGSEEAWAASAIDFFITAEHRRISDQLRRLREAPR